jgi:hypothetical protein
MWLLKEKHKFQIQGIAFIFICYKRIKEIPAYPIQYTSKLDLLIWEESRPIHKEESLLPQLDKQLQCKHYKSCVVNILFPKRKQLNVIYVMS